MISEQANGGGIYGTRMGLIREAASKTEVNDLTITDRREAVIAEVGADHIVDEPIDVQERAMNKYFEMRHADGNALPVMVDTVHGKEPSLEEITSLLRTKYPNLSKSYAANLYRRLFVVANKMRSDLPDLVPKPDKQMMNEVWKLYRDHEARTDTMAWDLADNTGMGSMRAKKPRGVADANRQSFYKKQRLRHAKMGGTKEDDSQAVQVREWPTSVRAALYWGVRRLAESSAGLDRSGQLKRPFMRISMHGCDDREYAVFGYEQGEGGELLPKIDENTGEKVIEETVPIDFVIGGGGTREREQLASPAVLDWFAREFVGRMHEKGAMVESENKVRDVTLAIERKGVDENGKAVPAQVYCWDNDADEVKLREMERVRPNGKKSMLAGVGLGLEHFRWGGEYEAVKADGTRRNMIMDGMGEGFQTIQFEMSRSVRDGKARSQVTMVLGEMANDFAVRFRSMSDL